ncbi:MAG: transcription initiation protein [Gammaproteobacteria bacterium]|nr:transcription initiation protein [Gammaproteobacteria bacterium]
MPRYIILMHDPAALQKKMRALNSDAVATTVGKYMAWADKMANAGKMRGGEKLSPAGGRVLNAAGGALKVLKCAYRQDEAVLGGFFIIEAGNYEQASELCRDNPQLEEGGIIEIRELEETKQG